MKYGHNRKYRDLIAEKIAEEEALVNKKTKTSKKIFFLKKIFKYLKNTFKR